MARSLRRPRALAGLLTLLLGLGILAATPSATSAPRPALDPRLTRPLDVDPTSSASRAAARDPRLAPLARASGTWLTEWFRVRDADPARDVRTFTTRRLLAAQQRGATPLLVLYAIPLRDCDAHSAGGLPTHAAYRAWVDEVAAAVRAVPAAKPMVVLEPDAISMLGTCAGQGDRLGSLAYATQKLSGAGAWVYLDAGNSTWLAPSVVAGRLVEAGVRSARGFATNVSNFRATADETSYADAVNRALAGLGVSGRRYVVDVSRNGAPDAVPPGTWCNPGGARLGPAPAVVGGPALDARLWVKIPGESDGECAQGDPPAGAWWDAGALRLLGYDA